MIVKAHQTAFHRGDGPVKVRPIDIPNSEIRAIDAEALGEGTVMDAILELAFRYGQNDFQPVPGCYSVSVGDVISFNESHARVLSAGFRYLPAGENPTAKTGRDAREAGRDF
jgi:hypothetical protein